MIQHNRGFACLIASIVAGRLWKRVGSAAVFQYGAFTAIAGTLALVVLTRPPRI